MTRNFLQSAKNCRSGTLSPPFQGFTLIELVVVVAVTSILLSIGIPSLSGMVFNSRRTTVLNELMTTLNYARTEAVTTGRRVTVCRLTDTSNSIPSCAASGTGGWENGWIVFVDSNRDGIREPDEPLLREHERLVSGTTLRGNSKLADTISFNVIGGTSENGRLVYCDQRGWSNDARIVVIATTGRVRITTASMDSNTTLRSCLS